MANETKGCPGEQDLVYVRGEGRKEEKRKEKEEKKRKKSTVGEEREREREREITLCRTPTPSSPFPPLNPCISSLLSPPPEKKSCVHAWGRLDVLGGNWEREICVLVR